MFWRWLWALLSPLRVRVKRDPRATFDFWDGSRYRSVDPIAVWAALTAELGDDLADALATVSTPAPAGVVGVLRDRFDAARQAAAVKVADAACRAFGVEPYADGVGLTVAERVSLAAAYLGRVRRLGDAARPTSASP